MSNARTRAQWDPATWSAEMLRSYLEGDFGPTPVFHRVAVIKVDHVGGQLAGPSGEIRQQEIANPKGSILGQIVTDAADLSTPSNFYQVFWPLFPHDLMPVKEGEHVYAIFEDLDERHGLWLARIPDADKVTNLNYTAGSKRFVEEGDDDLEGSTAATERVVRDLEENPEVLSPADSFDLEEDDVPEFNSRVGDRIIHGSNNSAIILSRDRVDTVDSGAREKAGMVDIVVGRSGKDLSMADDSARVMVTMKSDIDSNFSIDAGEGTGEASAVVAKGDQLRLVAREGIKIVVESGTTSIVIDKDGKVSIETPEGVEVSSKEMKISTDDDIVLDAGGDVKVGSSDANSKLVKGDGLKTFLQQLMEPVKAMVVDVVGIPGLGVANSNVGTLVDQAFTSYETTVLSDKNKVE